MNLETALRNESFIAWLETMPPTGKYDYCDNEGCLIFRYLKAMGFPVTSVDPISFTLETFFGAQYALPPLWNDIAIDTHEFWDKEKQMMPRRTFGAALERARKHLLAKT